MFINVRFLKDVSPSGRAYTSIIFSFYPYVDGNEEAVIKVYGR